MKRLLLAMGVALAVLLPANTHAAQAITITPTSIDKVIKPGETLSGSTQVLNQADTAFDFKVYSAPYSVNGEEYDPSFTPIPGATDVSKWIALKTAKTHLEPYSTSALNYTIKVPANAKPGSYFGVIFAETSSKVDGTGVVTQKRVGTVVYIQVAGNAVRQGKVITWDVPWFQEPNLTETLRLENTGSVHYPAIIHTEVKDLFGNPKFTYTQQRNVLPEKVRKVVIKWEKTPALGIFKVDGSVDILGQKQPLSTKYVLVMSKSVQQGILIVVALIILYLIIRMIWRKRKSKRSKKKAEEGHEETPNNPTNS